MAVRRESVNLELTGSYARDMAEAAAATQLMANRVRALDRAAGNLDTRLTAVNGNLTSTNTNLGNFATQSSAVSRSTRSTSSGMDDVTRSSNQTSQSINQLTGRLGLFADAALILGPGLIPIAAVGTQALAGLTMAATAAAVAGGSAIVAFQGVADAVKAVQGYQDDPSLANLEKARDEMQKLAPATRQFVMEFQKTRPMLADIRDSAATGWFPGLTIALRNLDELAPKLENILLKTGTMGGLLTADATKSLAGPRWDEFLTFIADEVPSAMASLTRTMGDLGHGAAEMLMAFDPGNDSFLAWLEDVADGFDRWASSAEGREGIQNFLAYARENGPEVADLFTSLVGALTAITQAAAPLGGPVLKGLTAVSEMVRVIAESDMATPLLAAVAALRLMQRVQGLAAAGQARLNSAMVQTNRTAAVTTAQYNRAGAVGASANRWSPGYSGVRGQGDYGAYLAGALTAPRPQDIRAQQRAQRAQMARMGGAALGVGLLASGAASEIGLTNTAMLTLAGSMAGPVGAALGAVAGLSMDAADGNNALTSSIEAAGAALKSGDFASGLTALADAEKAQADFADKIDSGKGFGSLKDPSALLANTKSGIEGIFGDNDIEDSQKQLDALNKQMFISQHAAAGLADAMGTTRGPLDGSTRSITELQHALELARPAMDRLGISQQDLTAAKNRQTTGFGAITDAIDPAGSYDALTDRIARTADYMDSAAGRAAKYSTVLQSLARDEGSAADQADAFREAMSALVDPALDAEAALQAQVDALQAIRKLNPSGGFDAQGGDNAQANASATREYKDAVQERIATMINAKRSEEDIASALSQSREQFIESGRAAGFSTKEMKKRADQIGLTPKLVETTFTALGISRVDRQTASLKAKYDALPKNVRSYIRTEGVPKTIADAKRVADELKLTAKDRRALLRLVTEGMGAAAAARSLMNSLRDKTVTLRINEIRTLSQTTLGRVGGRADGGSIPKDGGTYEDKFLYMLAPGEEVISNRRGQADRFRADRAAGRIPGYADGGTVGALADGGTAFPKLTAAGLKGMSLASLNSEFRENARALKEFRTSLKASTSALEKERQKREDFKSYRSEVSGSLSGELTGNGLAGFDAGVSANKNDARSALWALRKAKKNGLDGPLFDLVASSGDINLIKQFSELNSRQIAQREYRYGASRSAQNALGNFASQEKFDDTLVGINKTIKSLDRSTRKLGKDVERGALRGTQLGAERKRRRVSTRTRAGR